MIVAQLDFGRESDDRLHAQRIELDRLDTRPRIRLDLLLLDGFGHHVGHQSVDRVFDDAVGAEHAFDHRSGRLAASEAGHVDLTGETSERLVDSAVYALLLDFDRE